MEIRPLFDGLFPKPGDRPDLDMLAAAVAADPDCDTTRLAYADSLGEAGLTIAESLQRVEVHMRVFFRHMVQSLAVPAEFLT